MLNLILIAVAVILLTIGIVWLIDKFVPNKVKPLINLVLLGAIGLLGYQTFMSVYGEIKFNEIKEQRYAEVIEKMVDIRDSQLAYREVTGKYAKTFPELVKFIDTAQFTITQRRDTTVLDAVKTRQYGGVPFYKDEVIIDILGHVSVKDSLFKSSDSYKKLNEVPFAKPGTQFTMNAGEIGEEDDKIKTPVFEVTVKKDDILFDQEPTFVAKEKHALSVEAVNGDAIKVGSMTEVNTSGNWPKNYGNSKK